MKPLFAGILAGLFLFLPVSWGVALANAASLEPTGTRWAVCIGVSDYRDPDLADLRHAGNDAREVAGALKTRGGFEHVVLLTDALGPKDPSYPSKRHILASLDRIRSGIDSEDTVVFFFSGHGVTDPGGRSFLLPADAMVRNVPGSGIPLDTIQDFLKRVQAAQRVLILDAARPVIWKKGPPLQGAYPDRYLRDGVTAVFYAAKKGTFSHDHDDAPFSVFGGALAAGLHGEADRELGGDNDGVVSLMELGGYVNEKVTAWSLASGERQAPYIRFFEAGAATLAMTGAAEGADERVLAEVRPEAPRLPEEVSKEDRAERPPETSRPAGPVARPAAPPAPVPAPVERDILPSEADEIEAGAPAPSIDDVGSEESVPPEETETKEAPAVAAAPAVEEARPVEPGPSEKAGVRVEPPAGGPPRPTMPAPVIAGDEKAAEFEADDRRREERVVTGREAPSVPEAPPLTPVSLRSQPMDLPAEGVKSLLEKNDFYATCWTYNGDFCNPTGEFENIYQDNGDGTVTDRRTRLMWQKEGSPAPMTWTEAAEYAQKLNQDRFAGHADWRVPTVDELASLMERSWLNDDLFIDPVFGSGQKYCWAADTRGVERAWKSNFHLGFFLDFPMSELSSVRAVRSLRP